MTHNLRTCATTSLERGELMDRWPALDLPRMLRASAVAAMLVAATVNRAGAQAAAPDSTLRSARAPRADLSGVLFANYQYGGPRGSRSANRFEAERAYLTVRGRLSDRASIRVTADVYQQRDTARDDYYGGWTFRAKYAFLQYELLTGGSSPGFRANARLGMLSTVVIEQEEVFWPRWISNVGLERAGFFSSADVGAAATLVFPRKLGELYATVTNGPGYQTPESDRFKDAAVRLTITPFGSAQNEFLRTLAVSPWVYNGSRASKYAAGLGSIAPIPEARTRDRWGVLTGVNGRWLTLAGHWGVRRDEVEALSVVGADSAVEVRAVDAQILSGLAIARPFARYPAARAHPLGVLFRVDAIEDLDIGGDRTALIAGLIWSLGPRFSVALDYQEQTLDNQPAGTPEARIAALDTRTWYLHTVALF